MLQIILQLNLKNKQMNKSANNQNKINILCMAWIY